jgi:hypothetical protein
MKIGNMQLHWKARSHARLNHVSALLPLAIIFLAPNCALADCGHVRQGIMVDRTINWEALTVPLPSNRRPEESSEW